MELYVQSRTGEHVLRADVGQGRALRREIWPSRCAHASEDGVEGTGVWWRCLEKTGRLRRQEIRRKSWGMLSLNTSQLHKSNRQNKRTLGDRVEDPGREDCDGEQVQRGETAVQLLGSKVGGPKYPPDLVILSKNKWVDLEKKSNSGRVHSESQGNR